jgi:hypothetical protein
MYSRMSCERFFFAAAMIAVGACTPRVSTRSDTTVGADTVLADSEDALPQSRTDSLDLSGRWVTGFDNEPAIRETRLQRDCRYTPAAWLLDQRGDSVYAWQAKAQWVKGTAAPIEPMPAVATGRLRRHSLVLSDGANRWVLAYDGRSGHLHGTLNGASFWAMRQILEQPKEQCIPVP